MIRTYREQAIVLRSYKLGEADRILVLLGRDSGQIRAVAKGVRRTSSKFGSRLASFNLVDVQLHRGRSLDVVAQAETLSAYSAALSDGYPAFSNAKLMVEIAQRLTEGREEPAPEQFELLHGALHALAAGSKPPTLVGTAYVLRSMALEGWLPELRTCVSCGQEGNLSRFSPEGGGAFCASCAPPEAAPLPPGAAELLDALVSADWVAAGSHPSELWEQAREVAGAWSQHHLEQRLKALPFATAGAVN